MASILKRLKGLLPLLVLAALSLRVITGAAEVQVNFTSIIIEQYKSLGSDVDKDVMLRGVVAESGCLRYFPSRLRIDRFRRSGNLA